MFPMKMKNHIKCPFNVKLRQHVIFFLIHQNLMSRKLSVLQDEDDTSAWTLKNAFVHIKKTPAVKFLEPLAFKHLLAL